MRVERKRDGVTEIDDVLLIETQGETTLRRSAAPQLLVVVVDRVGRDVAVIASAASKPAYRDAKSHPLPATAGKRVVQMPITGLLVWRTVAMIASEALDALQKGSRQPKKISIPPCVWKRELPVRAGAWGERLGWQRLLTLLENLQRHYGEERYRPCSAAPACASGE